MQKFWFRSLVVIAAAGGIAGLSRKTATLPQPAAHFAAFARAPGRVGVDYPVVLTGRALTPFEVAEHLSVHPDMPLAIQYQSPRRVVLHPLGVWPAERHIVIRYGSASTQFTTDDDKWVRVDLTHQTVTAYLDHHPVRTMRTSTGVAPRWTTPGGTFWIFRKVLDDHMKGGVPGTPDSWDVKHVPFSQYFVGGVAFHGAWWTNTFGVPKSHGCVQLSTRPPGPGKLSDAEWLWRFTDIGTPVTVTGTTPPAPPRPEPSMKPSPTTAPFSATSAASSNR